MVIPLLFFAQKQNDFILWEGFSLKYKINPQLSADFKSQFRMENNVTQFKSVLFNPSATYKPAKKSKFKFTVGYRFSLTPTENKHRIYTKAAYGFKLPKKNFSASARIKLTKEGIGNERGEIIENFIRPKINIGYKLKELNLAVFYAQELFYDFTKYQHKFNQLRNIVGLNYEMSKRSSITLSFIRLQTFNVANRKKAGVLVFSLNSDLTVKK